MELRADNTFTYAFAGHISRPGYGGETTVVVGAGAIAEGSMTSSVEQLPTQELLRSRQRDRGRL